MSRTLEEIKIEISDRFVSKEYLPFFISRSESLKKFANTIGEFFAPYIKQIENFKDLYTNEEILKQYLVSKGLFISGFESLETLQNMLKKRFKILYSRGTLNVISEIRNMINGEFYLSYYSQEKVGFCCRRSSPCYRENNLTVNLCFLNSKEIFVWNFLPDLNLNKTRNEIISIVKRFFESKHISSIYLFNSAHYIDESGEDYNYITERPGIITNYINIVDEDGYPFITEQEQIIVL